MRRIILIIVFFAVLFISCQSNQNESKKGEQEKPSQMVAPDTAKKDSVKYPKKPEGYKSIHQYESEQHANEPSRIN